ncbi:hypothetical protein KEJ39_08360 [Candidatus Bathyarchaeota archaeon]|nr:hypothetical protein [Candidatus Bathyarchaeota archaeon]
MLLKVTAMPAATQAAQADHRGVPKTGLDYAKRLDESRDFADVFTLVKRAVKETLAQARAGLMLVLADLPLQVGAFHEVGSNTIVLNRRLLGAVMRSCKSTLEINSYVFAVLLHEYLHSLGHVDEREVRELSFQVARSCLGEDHPAMNFLVKGFTDRKLSPPHEGGGAELPQLIPDLERTAHTYIH